MNLISPSTSYNYTTVVQLGPRYIPVQVTARGLVDFSNAVAVSSLQLAQAQAEALGKKRGIFYQNEIITIQTPFMTIAQIESDDQHWHPVKVSCDGFDVLRKWHCVPNLVFSAAQEPARKAAQVMADTLHMKFRPGIGSCFGLIRDEEIMPIQE